MKPRATSRLSRIILLLAGIIPGMAAADIIYGHSDDAEFNTNSSGAMAGGPNAVSGSDLYVGRQYYANVANHYVVPFQLPDLGPGTFSDVSVTFNTTDIDTANQVNLYATPEARAASATLPSDVRGASDHRSTGTRIMAAFLTSTSTGNTAYTTPANGVVDAALSNWLNTAYADGAKGGQYVFMRLSPNALYPTSHQRGFRFASANHPDSAKRPVLTYTFNATGSPPPSIVAFTGSPAIVTQGGTSVLAWEVNNADTVTISNGIGTVVPVGSAEVSPVGTVTYTLTATSAGGTRTATATVGLAGTAFHRYFRFTPTKLRNNASANSVQIAEFEMIMEGNPIPGATATNPGGKPVTDGEGPLQAVDNNLDSKWLDFTKGPLVLDFGQIKSVNGYRFATANDSDERDPVSWKVEGSNNGTTWTLLDEQFDFAVPMDRQTYITEQLVLGPAGPNGAPAIGLFQASPAAFPAGGSTTLEWNVLNATTVTISEGVGTVSAVGTQNVSPATTTTYTLTATNAQGTSTATALATVIGPGPFRHYRFVPTRDRVGGTPPGSGGEDFQIAEFQMLFNGTWVPCPAAGVTSPGASRAVGHGEGAGKANDNRPAFVASGQAGDTSQGDSKWNDSGMPPLQYDFGVTQDVTGYRICTANDSEDRDPVSWRVEGSHDGSNWVLVDEKNNYATTTARNTYLPDFPIAPFTGPAITFTASAPQIVTGGSATLNWNVTGATADSISINQGIGAVPASGSRSVSPAATTTYTLTATGSGVTKSQSVTVEVVAGLPLHYNFDDATFEGWTDVSLGNTGTQGWSTTTGHGDVYQGTNSIRSQYHDNSHPTMILRSPSFLLNGSGDLIAWLAGGSGNVASLAGTAVAALPANSVNNGGFQGVALRNANTGSYVLSARRPGPDGEGGNSYQQVGFTAAELAALDQAAAYTLDLVDSNHGSWAWSAMDSVRIPGNLGVGSLPQIASFSAAPATISMGGTSTLAWEVSGATSISISQGIGSGLAASGSVEITPTATTTTYTLTASNGSGAVTATATVTISAPVIASFTASPQTIAPGESSTLTWSVSGATGISISNSVGNGLAASGSRSVSPAATTTYTLTATSPHGTTTADVIVGVALPGPYRYYRFVPTALRDPGDSSVQIAEFQMLLNGNRLSGATASETPADSPGGEGPAEGNDNDLDTKWLNFSRTDARLILDFGTATEVSGYRFATANDSDGRDPVSWRVEGSHDNTAWVVLDIQTSASVPTARKTFLPDLQLPTSGPGPIGSITAIALSPDLTTVTLTWESTPATSYTIQRSPSMTAGTWTDVKANIASQGAATTDSVPAGTGDKQFFRVKRQ
jgi:hypothetical protein